MLVSKTLVLVPYLCTHYDWLVKKAIVDLLIRMKGNLKHTSCNWLNPSRAKNKVLSSASQALLTKVLLHL